MSEDAVQEVAEFATVQSVFVRRRNCLLLRADFTPLFVDHYLHLMQHGLRHPEREDALFKQLLAFFTLHLVSRPWKEYHAWTLNLREAGADNAPLAASLFVSGSSTEENVIGRVFTENVKTPERNMLFAQAVPPGREPQTSVIVIHGGAPADWVEDFYRQSEQREARAFELPEDRYALLAAQPGADLAWLAALKAEDVPALDEREETKLLETRRFFFRCGCTLNRILPAIRAMRHDFADILSEQGRLEVSCPRCGAVYVITPEQIAGPDRP